MFLIAITFEHKLIVLQHCQMCLPYKYVTEEMIKTDFEVKKEMLTRKYFFKLFFILNCSYLYQRISNNKAYW